MKTLEDRIAAKEEAAKKAAEKAIALKQKAAQLQKQLENKRKLAEAREYHSEHRQWGRRPKETKLKILAGVGILSTLRELQGGDRAKLQRAILSHLDEKDRAFLLESADFKELRETI